MEVDYVGVETISTMEIKKRKWMNQMEQNQLKFISKMKQNTI